MKYLVSTCDVTQMLPGSHWNLILTIYESFGGFENGSHTTGY